MPPSRILAALGLALALALLAALLLLRAGDKSVATGGPADPAASTARRLTETGSPEVVKQLGRRTPATSIPSATAQRSIPAAPIGLDQGSGVVGSVLVGPGTSPAGLVVHLDGMQSGDASRVSADGEFSFEGIPAGRHILLVPDEPGVVMWAEPSSFDVAPGEIRQVLLDLRRWQPCRVRVLVLEEDLPVRGAFVKVCPEAQGQGWMALGSTDETGWVEGECPAAWSNRIVVASRTGLDLACAEIHPPTTPGGRVESVVRISTGQMTVVFPDDLVVPDVVAADVVLRAGDSAKLMLFASGGAGFPASRGGRWIGRSCDLGRIPAGEYALELSLWAHLGGAGWQETGDNFAGRATVAAGRRATCVLERE